MSAQLGRENVHDLAPEEVARGIAEGKVLLVDVREPNETEVERYPEAFYLPMSEFDPAAIPDPAGRRGRVCLPLRQSLRHRLANGTGCGAPLRCTPRRGPEGLERTRAGNRELTRSAPKHQPFGRARAPACRL